MTWRDIVRRAGPPAAVLVAAALGIAVSGLLNGQAPAVTASWTGWLNSGLQDYAATAGQWNSGDNAVQVALPGGRALWLFNDSYYGPVRADGTVSPATPLVRNTMLISSGSGRSFRVQGTITGPVSNGTPTAAVPPVPGSPAGSWAWPDGAIVVGGAVEAIYTVFALQGVGPLDYVPVANEVVTMPLTSLPKPSGQGSQPYSQAIQPSGQGSQPYSQAIQPSGQAIQPSGYVIQPSGFGQASLTAGCGAGGTGCVQWGIGLEISTSCPPPTDLAVCAYVYGEVWPAPGDSRRTLVVAVAPRDDLADTSTWWYQTASGWSRSLPLDSAQLAAPLGRDTSFSAGSVYRLGDDDYLVLGSGHGGVVAYYARHPWLSGARAVRLFPAPASRSVPGFLAYQFHVDPAYSHGTSVVMGFSVTSFDHDASCLNYAPYYDVSAYQPEFYSVTLPATASAVDPQPLPPPRLRPFRPRPAAGASWSSGACPP
jgi:hypothetical protein